MNIDRNTTTQQITTELELHGITVEDTPEYILVKGPTNSARIGQDAHDYEWVFWAFDEHGDNVESDALDESWTWLVDFLRE